MDDEEYKYIVTNSDISSKRSAAKGEERMKMYSLEDGTLKTKATTLQTDSGETVKVPGGKVVVPRSRRELAFFMAHVPLGGGVTLPHLRWPWTSKLATEVFYWKDMEGDIEDFTQRCLYCSKRCTVVQLIRSFPASVDIDEVVDRKTGKRIQDSEHMQRAVMEQECIQNEMSKAPEELKFLKDEGGVADILLAGKDVLLSVPPKLFPRAALIYNQAHNELCILRIMLALHIEEEILFSEEKMELVRDLYTNFPTAWIQDPEMFTASALTASGASPDKDRDRGTQVTSPEASGSRGQLQKRKIHEEMMGTVRIKSEVTNVNEEYNEESKEKIHKMQKTDISTETAQNPRQGIDEAQGNIYAKKEALTSSEGGETSGVEHGGVVSKTTFNRKEMGIVRDVRIGPTVADDKVGEREAVEVRNISEKIGKIFFRKTGTVGKESKTAARGKTSDAVLARNANEMASRGTLVATKSHVAPGWIVEKSYDVPIKTECNDAAGWVVENTHDSPIQRGKEESKNTAKSQANARSLEEDESELAEDFEDFISTDARTVELAYERYAASEGGDFIGAGIRTMEHVLERCVASNPDFDKENRKLPGMNMVGIISQLEKCKRGIMNDVYRNYTWHLAHKILKDNSSELRILDKFFCCVFSSPIVPGADAEQLISITECYTFWTTVRCFQPSERKSAYQTCKDFFADIPQDSIIYVPASNVNLKAALDFELKQTVKMVADECLEVYLRLPINFQRMLLCGKLPQDTKWLKEQLRDFNRRFRHPAGKTPQQLLNNAVQERRIPNVFI